MSAASDYAAAYAAGQTLLAAPAPFVGPNGRMEVTSSGNLRIVPNTPGVNQEIPSTGVPAIITWLMNTFT